MSDEDEPSWTKDILEMLEHLTGIVQADTWPKGSLLPDQEWAERVMEVAGHLMEAVEAAEKPRGKNIVVLPKRDDGLIHGPGGKTVLTKTNGEPP